MIDIILTILFLSFIEIILSTDNAVVLSLLTRSLPEHQRKKALFIGLLSAFVMRAVMLYYVTYIFESIYIHVIGAIYLIYLCLFHFISRKNKDLKIQPRTFWHTVFLIEAMDLLFAVDSIIAGVALINGDRDRLWLVYIGGMIGLIGIRYAASVFNKLIDSFHNLENSAYLLVGWIGIKMGFGVMHIPILSPIFWGISILIIAMGFVKNRDK